LEETKRKYGNTVGGRGAIFQSILSVFRKIEAYHTEKFLRSISIQLKEVRDKPQGVTTYN
jgi:hypothetical protein